jgi:hypothetical protein
MPSLGGPQETVFLTESGAYQLVMLSRKPVAKAFRKWLAKLAVDHRKKLRGEQEAKHRDALSDAEARRALVEAELLERLRKEKEATERAVHEAADEAARHARHTSLIEAFKGRPVVYFGRIREHEGRWLIKIGKTDHLQTRAGHLVGEYGAMSFFHAFECSMNENFEEYLQKHPTTAQHVFKERVPGGKKSNGEVFLTAEADIDALVDLARHNLHRFGNKEAAAEAAATQEARFARIERELARRPTVDAIADLVSTHVAQSAVAEGMAGGGSSMEAALAAAPEPPEALAFAERRRYTQARGPKVQRYSPDGKTLMRTYVGFTEVTRDPAVAQATQAALRQAIKKNAVYKRYRWAALDRAMPDNTVQALAPTAARATHDIGLVAMLNLAGNRIEDVFNCQSAAAEDRQQQGCASICNAIKRGTASGGHLFRMWIDCDAALQEDYLARAELPPRLRRGRSEPIDKLDATTGAVVFPYDSIADVLTELRIGRATLLQAIESRIVLKGYRWRRAQQAQQAQQAQPAQQAQEGGDTAEATPLPLESTPTTSQ